MVMISTPLALFSAISPLYEDNVKLGASLTSFTVIVTLAVAVSPAGEQNMAVRFGRNVLRYKVVRVSRIAQTKNQ